MSSDSLIYSVCGHPPDVHLRSLAASTHACWRMDDGMCISFFLDYVCHNVKVLAALIGEILVFAICDCPIFVCNSPSRAKLVDVSYNHHGFAGCRTYFHWWMGQLAVHCFFTFIDITRQLLLFLNKCKDVYYIATKIMFPSMNSEILLLYLVIYLKQN